MLTDLARQLIRREVFSFGSKNAPVMGAPTRRCRAVGRVIVLGGAVMNAKVPHHEDPFVGHLH
jgi:hypothetical protein